MLHNVTRFKSDQICNQIIRHPKNLLPRLNPRSELEPSNSPATHPDLHRLLFLPVLSVFRNVALYVPIGLNGAMTTVGTFRSPRGVTTGNKRGSQGIVLTQASVMCPHTRRGRRPSLICPVHLACGPVHCYRTGGSLSGGLIKLPL